MSTTRTGSKKGQDNTLSAPILPANVQLFSPADPQVAEALLSSRIFTRLSISAQTDPANISDALHSVRAVESFCLKHRNALLIFGGGNAQNQPADDPTDSHHEQFRLIALALKRFDIGLDVARCVFDTADILEAGFQLDKLNDGAVMVIDLMDIEDEDDEDTDDDDGDNENLEGFLAKEPHSSGAIEKPGLEL
ncbi:hypothetical protein VTL71DRAFT_7387 [Oculimacula yallundae]|uniref:Uncharacterized protein n=1 Tax=Oculimacula yallundae TaxID=86028 RepID=A0ABR4BVM7_9HELO